ncbi:MAG: RNase adapter RapZ [Ilumatobacter coccineus]|uniref:RNase adapter RapZ n=1 Tax=Ilumatobacter coccineus TaxID=467094 RepID=A0A2G6K8G4_9ACTN|nr:MAG: RNase adapter RapZ [Ilumatobacter coccineus]
MAQIVVITGLSGAGRSGAADVLDDLGYYVIDNLPTPLLPTIVQLAIQPGGGINRLALVSGRNHSDILPEVAKLRESGHSVTTLFLDARTPVLVQRYNATRRKHPFSDESHGLLEAIEAERELLASTKYHADLVIDTSDLTIHQLKDRVIAAFAEASSSRMYVSVQSFGYTHGLPLNADIVMDVRFLPNPHWDEELRPLTGQDERVQAFVLGRSVTQSFLDRFEQLLVGLIPNYESEGRSYLTIAIGCTGGKHRSVAIAEEISRRLADADIEAHTSHRDVTRS